MDAPTQCLLYVIIGQARKPMHLLVVKRQDLLCRPARIFIRLEDFYADFRNLMVSRMIEIPVANTR